MQTIFSDATPPTNSLMHDIPQWHFPDTFNLQNPQKNNSINSVPVRTDIHKPASTPKFLHQATFKAVTQ